MSIHERLADIQRQLRAPKNKNNDFGGYKYRNAESILAAFKALDVDGGSLRCTDTLQEVGGQIFVTARAVLTIDGQDIEAEGHAMHPLQKKGMDASQITGSASSYARKYALCGLFAIEDESADPDSRDNREERGQTPPPPQLVSEAEAAILDDLANRAGSDRAAIFNHLGVKGNTWSDLPESMFQKVRKGMQDKLDKMDQEHDAATRDAQKEQAAPDLGGDEIPEFGGENATS